MSVEWVRHSLEAGPEDPIERFVYLTIGERVNKDDNQGHAWCSSPDIMSRTKLSESTIRRAIARMESAGWLRVAKGIGKRNVSHYYLQKVPLRHLLEQPEKVSERHLNSGLKGVAVDVERCQPDGEKVSLCTSKGVTVTNPPHPLIGVTRTEPEVEPKDKSAHAPFVLPEWVPAMAWQGYEETRRRIKRQMTDRARELAVKKLEELRQAGHDPEGVLNNSIFNSWQGLFPLRTEGDSNGRDAGSRGQTVRPGSTVHRTDGTIKGLYVAAAGAGITPLA